MFPICFSHIFDDFPICVIHIYPHVTHIFPYVSYILSIFPHMFHIFYPYCPICFIYFIQISPYVSYIFPDSPGFWTSDGPLTPPSKSTPLQEHFGLSLALLPSARAHFGRGSCLAALRRRPEAAEELAKAVAMCPQMVGAIINLAGGDGGMGGWDGFFSHLDSRFVYHFWMGDDSLILGINH